MCLLWTRAMQTGPGLLCLGSNIPWNFVQTDRTVPILSAAFGGIGSRTHQLSAPQTSNHFIFGGGNYDNSLKK